RRRRPGRQQLRRLRRRQSNPCTRLVCPAVGVRNDAVLPSILTAADAGALVSHRYRRYTIELNRGQTAKAGVLLATPRVVEDQPLCAGGGSEQCGSLAPMGAADDHVVLFQRGEIGDRVSNEDAGRTDLLRENVGTLSHERAPFRLSWFLSNRVYPVLRVD